MPRIKRRRRFATTSPFPVVSIDTVEDGCDPGTEATERDDIVASARDYFVGTGAGAGASAAAFSRAI